MHRTLSLWLPRCPGPRSTWSLPLVGAHTSRPAPAARAALRRARTRPRQEHCIARCPSGCHAVLALARLGVVRGSVRTRRAPPPLIALLVRVVQGNVPRWCNQMIGAIPTVAELLVLVRLGLVRARCFLSTACKPLPSRGVGLTVVSSRCLCSSGLRLHVDTGKGAAPGVFLSTALPAAAISRR